MVHIWDLGHFCELSTHIVQQVSPALHGDTLEDGEDGEQDVIKLGDAVVWSQPVRFTRGTLRTQPRRKLCPTWKLFPDLTWGDVEESQNKNL